MKYIRVICWEKKSDRQTEKCLTWSRNQLRIPSDWCFFVGTSFVSYL